MKNEIIQIEEMLKSTLLNPLKRIEEVNRKMIKVIDTYLFYIERNVPEEFRKYFGVGVIVKHPEHGVLYGFFNKRLSHETEVYTPTEGGFNYAGDFYYWVPASTFYDRHIFLSEMLEFLAQGLEEIEKVTASTETSLQLTSGLLKD